MRFTKMHGIGNDYVYINCFDVPFPKDPASWRGRWPIAISAWAATG